MAGKMRAIELLFCLFLSVCSARSLAPSPAPALWVEASCRSPKSEKIVNEAVSTYISSIPETLLLTTS